MRRNQFVGATLGFAWLLLCGCSDRQDVRGPQPPSESKAVDQPHHLADKPLKTFPEQASQQWKKEEAIKLADKRVSLYKHQHMAQVDPTSPDPLAGKSLDLEQALAGLDGDGSVKAVIETTEGEFSCELDTAGQPLEVAHFIGLARGTRPWWDSARGRWSTNSLYTAIPVYKVVPGEGFLTGCPMAVGFAEVGFRVAIPMEKVVRANEAYQLALVGQNRVSTFGAQFAITAKANPSIEELTHVIGRCDGADTIQKIAGQEVTKAGYPINEVLVRRVTITR